MTHPIAPLTATKPSYIREILNLVKSSDVISLAGGLPSPETFAMDIIEPAMIKIAGDASLFQYAQTTGFEPLVTTIRQRYEVNDRQEVIVTNGSQQGIDLCIRAFIQPGDKVIVEAPSYLGALQILSLSQANVISITQEIDGPNLAELEQYFADGDITAFYGIPDFHNPTGCCWSLEKRQQVGELCLRYDVLFIEDAPYREMRFTGKPLPLASEFCTDNAIVLYSFSKMIAPGIRIGALITPKKWFSPLCTLKQATDLHTNIPMQALTHALLSQVTFDEHLCKINRFYQHRYQALCQSLSHLPQLTYSYRQVDGGMFVWLSIPDCNVQALAKAAIEAGVAVVPSSEFYHPNYLVRKCGDNTNISALRLNFSFNSPKVIEEAIQKLIPVLNNFGGG